MPSETFDSSEKYVQKQVSLVALITKTKFFLNNLLVPNPSDELALRYPDNMFSVSDANLAKAQIRPPELLTILGPPHDILKHNLESCSMTKILTDKIRSTLGYLESLKLRACEKSSKILVTGDLNAGKSTFVNALLNADILPTDQQPCTQSFCEIIPAYHLEAPCVYAIKDYSEFATEDPNTFVKLSIEEMQESIQNSDTDFTWYRLCWPVGQNHQDRRFTAGASLDISIIDSPGLNTDLFKTTSLFSKQADIDVVIFVLNAANHLTLSARDFLERALKEKEYIFFVVNRMDDIKNQERCKRVIMKQIFELSPSTWSESEELIHFISASKYLSNAESHWVAQFQNLEQNLRKFLVENRIRSKLAPIHTFLTRLLIDVDVLLSDNCVRIEAQLNRLYLDIEMIHPFYESLANNSFGFRNAVQNSSNKACEEVYSLCKESLKGFSTNLPNLINTTPWNGIFSIWKFRQYVIERVNEELKLLKSQIEMGATRIVDNGSHSLNAIATTYVHQTFSRSENFENFRISLSEENCIIKEPAAWDIIDFSAELSTAKLCMSTSAVSVIILGLRSNLLTGFRMLDFFVILRNSPVLASIAVAGGIFITSVLYLDVHGMVSRRLKHFLEESIEKSIPGLASSTESQAQHHLVNHSVRLIARFDEILAYQKKLRTEKDMELKRFENIRSHFIQHRIELEKIRAELNQFLENSGK